MNETLQKKTIDDKDLLIGNGVKNCHQHQQITFVRYCAAAIIAVLYVSSFLKDALVRIDGVTPRQYASVPGWFLALWGWLGLPFGIIGWYANPLFVVGLILFAFGRIQLSMRIAIVATLIALSSVLLRWPLFTFGPDRTQGAEISAPFSYGSGFYTWLGAMILLATVTSIVQAVEVRLRDVTHDSDS